MNIIQPKSNTFFYWNFIRGLGIFFYGITVPLELVFHSELPQTVIYIEYLFKIFFIADIFFNMRVAFLSNGKKIVNPEDIKKNYLKKGFWYDLFFSFPIDLVCMFFVPAHLVGIFQINHLLRVIQVPKIYRGDVLFLDESIYKRISKYLLICSLTAHWVSCGWLTILGLAPDETKITLYNKSMYWTITTLTTVGYGDITPSTNAERIYTMMVMILGVGLYGFVIGNISSLLVKVDSVKEEQSNKMNRLADFMVHVDAPSNFKEDVFNFYSHFLNINTSQGEMSFLNDLPVALKDQLILYANLKLINQVPMFTGVSQKCREDLAKSLEQTVIAPNAFIIHKGEVGEEMFFLARGSVEVLADDTKVLATLESGSFFGETALIQEEKRNADIRSLTYCNLYKLDKEIFLSILSKHEDLRVHIEEIINTRK